MLLWWPEATPSQSGEIWTDVDYCGADGAPGPTSDSRTSHSLARRVLTQPRLVAVGRRNGGRGHYLSLGDRGFDRPLLRGENSHSIPAERGPARTALCAEAVVYSRPQVEPVNCQLD
jgi:hypothetical protein